MPFVTKDWRDSPGDLTTPITAAALENLESRVTAGIPYENVLWHGAVGNNTGDQTQEIQAAIDACEATGGTVYIPRGIYRLLGSLELHAHVSLLGEGPQASILSWPTSLGAGTWAITPDLAQGEAVGGGNLSGLGFQGPGSWDGETMGGAVSDMNGVKIANGQAMENCAVSYFHRGLGVLQDHLEVTNSEVGANTYNLAFLAGDTKGGDHHYTSVNLTGATIASVYVESLLGISGSTFRGVHMGLAPYGILSATGRAGNNFITNSVFIASQFEWFGTAAIWGANTTDLIAASRWINCSSEQRATSLLPATTYEFFVRSGAFRGNLFGPMLTPTDEPGTAWFSASGAGNSMDLCEFTQVEGAFLRTNTAAFLHRADGGGPTFCSFVNAEGTSGTFCLAVGAITKGQLVKMYGEGGCLTYDDDTLVEAPMGVALQSGAINSIVAVATQGFIRDLLIADGTITDYRRFLKPAVTNGRVVQATGWSDGPIVGVSMGAAVSGGTINAHLRCGAWG